jgi:hypothetical protein
LLLVAAGERQGVLMRELLQQRWELLLLLIIV